MAGFLKAILVFLTAQSMGVFAHARDLDQLYAKAKFQLGSAKFTAYIADDDQKRAQGLMFIEKMSEDVGMLFVFETQQPLGFWMKNTLIPLSIGFFDKDGVLIDVQEMKVAESLISNEVPSYQSKKPALYALEMNRGWFARHKIKEGIQLEILSKAPSKLLQGKLTRH